MSDCRQCERRQLARYEDLDALKRYYPQLAKHSDEELEEMYAAWSRSHGADWMLINNSSRFNFVYWYQRQWALSDSV